jgi:hypothetical protein
MYSISFLKFSSLHACPARGAAGGFRSGYGGQQTISSGLPVGGRGDCAIVVVAMRPLTGANTGMIVHPG